jgi:hypothetical protein
MLDPDLQFIIRAKYMVSLNEKKQLNIALKNGILEDFDKA